MSDTDEKREEKIGGSEGNALTSKIEKTLPEKEEQGESRHVSYTVKFRRSGILIPIGVSVLGGVLLVFAPSLRLQLLGGVLLLMGILASLGLGLTLVGLKKHTEAVSEEKSKTALQKLEEQKQKKREKREENKKRM